MTQADHHRPSAPNADSASPAPTPSPTSHRPRLVLRSRHPGFGSTLKPILLYHIPKTGGTTLLTVLRAALKSQYLVANQTEEYRGPAIARYDSADDQPFPGPHVLVATHNPFGFHHRFRQSFALVNIQRETVSRVRSSYTYQCMRDGTTPTEEGFAAHIERPDMQNVAVKQLAGLLPTAEVGPEHQDLAWRHLQTVSHVLLPDDITDFLAYTLNEWGLPNIVSNEVMNKTRSPFMLAVDPYVDRILALNALDHALYQRVVQSLRRPPATPPPPAEGTSPHPLTVMIQDDDLGDRVEATITCRPTAAVADQYFA